MLSETLKDHEDVIGIVCDGHPWCSQRQKHLRVSVTKHRGLWALLK
jgi:hypothetical protein